MNTSNYLTNILIADDDGDDIEFLCEGIEKTLSSVKIDAVKNGEECLGYLAANKPPDVIFLDLNMPMLNGFECLKEMSKKDALKNTNVIIYSTSNYESDIETCRNMGATYYMVKPDSFNFLIDQLSTAFSGIASDTQVKNHPFVISSKNNSF